ncbi:MAG TPA: Yip1 family protein [Xanthobacteraceae bacterium]|jgi:hypothetical protein|nr:Yip1 family protein [Xanthobacteraceae bacterium]
MNLVERVKSILLTPEAEWKTIEREPGDPTYLFTNYVAILAAIPAIAGFIGHSLIGYSLPVVGWVREPIASGLAHAITGYVLAFVGVYVLAMIVDVLAPTFAGERNFPNALKLSVYSHTPMWLAGVFLMIPGLRFLVILGLYGFYLFWKGLPALMRSPEDRNLVYAVAVVGCAVIIALVFAAIESVVL